MKTLLITFLALISFLNIENQDNLKNITASFNGFENGIYTFTETDNEIYYFNRIEDSVSEKYDLTGLDFDGDKFKISYKIGLEEAKFGEMTIVHTIVDLKLER